MSKLSEWFDNNKDNPEYTKRVEDYKQNKDYYEKEFEEAKTDYKIATKLLEEIKCKN